MQEFTSPSNGLRRDWAVLRDLEKFLCKCHPGHHLLSFSPKTLENCFLLVAFFWLSSIAAAPLLSGPWQSWPAAQHLFCCPLKQRSKVADSHKQRSPCCLCWVLPLYHLFCWQCPLSLQSALLALFPAARVWYSFLWGLHCGGKLYPASRSWAPVVASEGRVGLDGPGGPLEQREGLVLFFFSVTC